MATIVFLSKPLVSQDLICVMHLLPEMIEVVAMMNFLSEKSLFKNLIAAISAKVTPPMKYTRTFFC